MHTKWQKYSQMALNEWTKQYTKSTETGEWRKKEQLKSQQQCAKHSNYVLEKHTKNWKYADLWCFCGFFCAPQEATTTIMETTTDQYIYIYKYKISIFTLYLKQTLCKTKVSISLLLLFLRCVYVPCCLLCTFMVNDLSRAEHPFR